MSQLLIRQMALGEAPPFEPLTVEQYHQMIRVGILPEGSAVELIDGLLVRKDRSPRGESIMGADPRHPNTIDALNELLGCVNVKGYRVRVQSSITLSDITEPEPDIAIARGDRNTFRHRHPGPNDLVAIMEVADSSLNFDRTTKLQKFALARISQYWIVNLQDNRIEVYTEPNPSDGTYAKHEDFCPGQTVRLFLDDGGTLDLPVNDILPS